MKNDTFLKESDNQNKDYLQVGFQKDDQIPVLSLEQLHWTQRSRTDEPSALLTSHSRRENVRITDKYFVGCKMIKREKPFI